MKKITVDGVKEVKKILLLFGYKTTAPEKEQYNGVDLYAIKKDKVFSVEIKMASIIKNRNVLRIRKVEKNRKQDDLIAIVFPNKYVLLEPMKDHLRNCNKTGDRYLLY